MDDDFENDIDLSDDNLDESLGDLGDLGDAAEVEAEPFDDASELGGTRSSGGARAAARLSAPEPEPARVARPPALKPAKKPAVAAVAKKAKAKKKAPRKAAKKKAAKKKAPAKKAKRKAGSKK